MKILLILFSCLVISGCHFLIHAQDKTPITTLLRYQVDHINGVYIPKDIEDAIGQIDKFLNDSTRSAIREISEERFSARAHLNFGMGLRNRWGLWGGSRLSKYLNDLGIYHPDDMSGIILKSYSRHLKGGEIDLNEQIEYYRKYWEDVQKDYNSSKRPKPDKKSFKKEMAGHKKGKTVYYDHPFGFFSEKDEDNYDEGICCARGKIMDLDLGRRLILVKLTESCSPKGVIIFDSHYDEEEEYNASGEKNMENGRQLFFMNTGDTYWFYYRDWCVDK